MKLRATYTFSPPPSHEIDTAALMDSDILEGTVSQKMERHESRDGGEQGKEGNGKGAVREGEGAYEWVVWEGDENGGNEEVEEVVRSLEDVIGEAAK